MYVNIHWVQPSTFNGLYFVNSYERTSDRAEGLKLEARKSNNFNRNPRNIF